MLFSIGFYEVKPLIPAMKIDFLRYKTDKNKNKANYISALCV